MPLNVRHHVGEHYPAGTVHHLLIVQIATEVVSYGTPHHDANVWDGVLWVNTLQKMLLTRSTLHKHTNMTITCMKVEPAINPEHYRAPIDTSGDVSRSLTRGMHVCTSDTNKRFSIVHVNSWGHFYFDLCY